MAPDPLPSPVVPSNSTLGSAVGGMAATLLILLLKAIHIEVDAVAAVSIGGGAAALFGWFFNGGKKVDTL